jgi:hypothetical protein
MPGSGRRRGGIERRARHYGRGACAGGGGAGCWWNWTQVGEIESVQSVEYAYFLVLTLRPTPRAPQSC